MVRPGMVVAVMALAATGVLAVSGGAQAASSGAIKGTGSGRCVDVPDRATANLTQVELWDCNGGTNQTWTLTSSKTLQVYGTKCLEVQGSGTAAGTKVVINACTGAANQQWTFTSNGTLTDKNSGKCLDANANGTANGTLLQIWTCNGQTNQSWSALTGGTPVTPTTPVTTSPSPGKTNLPCDIYAAGGTPCVAAHSMVRALYKNYNGRLYQVQRAKDDATLDIRTLSAGGYADSAAQDSFCSGTTCQVTVIYDQSAKGNNLTRGPGGQRKGPAAGGYDNLADAKKAPLTVAGHKVYGLYTTTGTGYRDNKAVGLATGDQPEGMYSIMDGTHTNSGCCFDYGNAETNSRNDGDGTMEAIYFGSNTHWGYGAGAGPWVMGDLENGMYSGSNATLNAGDPTIKYRFTTAIVKGEPNNHWAIRAGNAQSGALSTYHSGARPPGLKGSPGYNPMRKQGAITLGVGGDNSITGEGTWYEGAMTTGYPSDATENAIQANIVAAGFRA